MTEREAFEKWWDAKRRPEVSDMAGEEFWLAWQASRKQALKEAAAAVTAPRGAMSMFVNSSEFRGHDAAILESLTAIRSLSTPDTEGGKAK